MGVGDDFEVVLVEDGWPVVIPLFVLVFGEGWPLWDLSDEDFGEFALCDMMDVLHLSLVLAGTKRTC